MSPQITIHIEQNTAANLTGYGQIFKESNHIIKVIVKWLKLNNTFKHYF